MPGGKRILVTGDAGSIGSHRCELRLEAGAHVIIRGSAGPTCAVRMRCSAAGWALTSIDEGLRRTAACLQTRLAASTASFAA